VSRSIVECVPNFSEGRERAASPTVHNRWFHAGEEGAVSVYSNHIKLK